MSRTYKDRHWKLRFPESRWDFGTQQIAYEATRRIYNVETGHYEDTDETCTWYYYVPIAGIKTKKKRKHNNEWHWLGATPSWWTNLMMNRPQRRKGRMWERKVHFEDLEETDPPGVSKKPHQYYW